MPIEIRELIIKTTIEPNSNSALNEQVNQVKDFSPYIKEEIFKECKLYINRLIKQQKER